ncbi:MAG TPA: sigma-70 family RNA polymerase sigma factor [Xanthobacteraceae bacterium]|nr:sigma-70 family RNA polymerase sigma factor [Xanthobacteraceae bacterium]
MQYNPAISAAASSRLSSIKATSDQTLIGLIAKGDKDAMRLLFARHHLRVFRFLTRIVKSEETAEDLLNEVFLDVWRGARGFEARSQVTTWILGIARYKALSALRQRSYTPLDDDVAESLEDTADDPEVSMQKTDRSAVLQACLRQLSSAHRQVIDLVYYHEQSIEEIARVIGVLANTVKTRVFHARKRIAELMAASGIERAAL